MEHRAFVLKNVTIYGCAEISNLQILSVNNQPCISIFLIQDNTLGIFPSHATFIDHKNILVEST